MDPDQAEEEAISASTDPLKRTNSMMLRHAKKEIAHLQTTGVGIEEATALAFHRAGLPLEAKGNHAVWLGKCVSVFKEDIDHDIPKVVPRRESLVASMVATASEFDFLVSRDADAMHQKQEILDQVCH